MGAGSSVETPRARNPRSRPHRTRDHPKQSTEPHEEEKLLSKKEEPEKLKWPLPKIEKEEEFIADDKIEVNRYKLARHQFKKVTLEDLCNSLNFCRVPLLVRIESPQSLFLL